MTEAQTRSLLEQQNKKLTEQFKEELRCINESLTSAIGSSGCLDFQTAYKILRAGVEAIQKSIEIKSGDKR